MTATAPAPNLTARIRSWIPALASNRSADIVFGVALAVGVVAMLIINRDSWFGGDDFAYLYRSNELFEKGQYLDWLLGPHNEHWTMLGAVAFRIVFSIVGMNHYLPYLVPVLLAHVIVIVSLRALMIRAGIQYWVATTLSMSLIIFGGGNSNLNWAFQIGFVGSVMFGLLQILCVDHDGPINWRDGLGLVFGFLAVSAAGPGIAVVAAAVLLLVLLRRYKAALLQGGPLAAIYVMWYITYGRSVAGRTPVSTYTVAGIPKYIWTGISAALDNLTQLSGTAAVALVALVATILVLGVTRRTVAATAMLVGVVAFFLIIAYGRSFLGPAQASETRYAYVAGVLAATTLGLALCNVPLKSSYRWIPAVLLIGWMTIANPAAYYQGTIDVANNRNANREAARAIAAVPGIERAPASAQPVPGAPDITVGRTLKYTRTGVLKPDPDPSSQTILDLSIATLVTAGPATGAPTGAPVLGGTPRRPATTPGCETFATDNQRRLVIGPGAIDVTATSDTDIDTTLRDPARTGVSYGRKLTLTSGKTRITNLTPTSRLTLDIPDGTDIVICGLRD